jgi:hypothetical protein
VTGPQVRRDEPAQPVLGHAAALGRADRILVTAHPAEPPSAVAMRAAEGALESYLDRARDGRPAHLVTEGPEDRAAGPAPDRAPDRDLPEVIAADPLRRLFARHLRERLPDDDAGELHASVTAAAVVAALELTVSRWLADGARADGIAACRERLAAVAPLLPPDPGSS